jgi:hypothetical protein
MTCHALPTGEIRPDFLKTILFINNHDVFLVKLLETFTYLL